MHIILFKITRYVHIGQYLGDHLTVNHPRHASILEGRKNTWQVNHPPHLATVIKAGEASTDHNTDNDSMERTVHDCKALWHLCQMSQHINNSLEHLQVHTLVNMKQRYKFRKQLGFPKFKLSSQICLFCLIYLFCLILSKLKIH